MQFMAEDRERSPDSSEEKSEIKKVNIMSVTSVKIKQD